MALLDIRTGSLKRSVSFDCGVSQLLFQAALFGRQHDATPRTATFPSVYAMAVLPLTRLLHRVKAVSLTIGDHTM